MFLNKDFWKDRHVPFWWKLVALAIAVGGVWFWFQLEMTSGSSSQGQSAPGVPMSDPPGGWESLNEPAEPRPPEEPTAPLDPLPGAAPDASTAAPLPVPLDVEIVLRESGGFAAGEEIRLESADARRDTTTNIMGLARVALEPGVWLVTYPMTEPSSIEVDENHRSFELMSLGLPPQDRSVSGTVYGADGKPLGGAELIEVLGESKRRVALTDQDGYFAFVGRSSAFHLLATYDGHSSPSQPIKVPVRNRVFWVGLSSQLKLSFVERSPRLAKVRVFAGASEGLFLWRNDETRLVPWGVVDVKAVGSVGGTLVGGRVRVSVPRDGLVEAQVPMTPLKGLVVHVEDRNGAAIPGITVTASVLTASGKAVAARPSDGGDGSGSFDSRCVTDSKGTCQFPPPEVSELDLTFRIDTGKLWRLAHPVLAQLGDAPLTVVVEPAR